MHRTYKVSFWIIAGTILLVLLGTIVVQYNLFSNKQKAVKLAQKYVLQKYTQKMQYSSVRFSWVEPSLFHVVFSPINNPELFFEVLVQPNMSLNERVNERENFMPDNYYLKLVEFQLQEQLDPIFEEIWGPDGIISVHVDDPGIYGAYKVPVELNEQMTAHDMASFFNYTIYISPNCILDSQSRNGEANRVFELFQSVNRKNLCPDKIIIGYLKSKDNGIGESKNYTEFKNWENIVNAEEVKHVMD